MASLRARWTTFLDNQHRYPDGFAGRLIGERMVRQHSPETKWTIDLLDLQPADRVLELGFGAGQGLALALRQVQRGQVTGLDLSPTMLQAAARRNRAALRAGRLALVRANLDSLPLAGGRFDKIFSIHTFYFWPDARQTCAALMGLLNPGGTLVATLATGRATSGGEWVYWPVHDKVEALVRSLQQSGVVSAVIKQGPNSRQYNNLAVVVRKGGG